jgi:hypothetical protein
MKTTFIFRFLRIFRSRQDGYSLISLALFTVGFGIVLVSGSMVYNQWQARKAPVTTSDRIAELEQTMAAYLALYGRYPCPASLTVPLTSPQFGVEMKSSPTDSACTGQFTGTGTNGRRVWTGAVPVRTMNLPDEMAVDGWDHRFAYTITEAYTDTDNTPLNQDLSAVRIIDGNGNDATANSNGVTYAFLTMGNDIRGAYSASGQLIAPCARNTPAGTNCSYQDNISGGTLVSNPVQSHVRSASQFTHRVDYRSAPIPLCPENPSTEASRNLAYLIDTSGSMADAGGCPLSLGTDCSRIDVARWALRRIIPVRIQQAEDAAKNNDQDNPFKTMMTGFIDNSTDVTATKLLNSFGNLNVQDEASTLNQIDGGLCPDGATPLGVHIDALAQKLLGTKIPNTTKGKIIVISDGLSNVGEDPVAVATRLHDKNHYPNLQIDIIDVTGNPQLKQVADITGGTYSLSTDGDKILDTMLSLSGVCKNGPAQPKTPPVDKRGCGSSGNWWN